MSHHLPGHGAATSAPATTACSEVTHRPLERFGPAVHVPVANDGGPSIQRISELANEVWLKAFERHFFYMVRSVPALPYMTTEGGSILTVVSGVVERPAVGMAASVGVGSAVIGYAKTLALEVARQNIHVHTLLPGCFDTTLLSGMLERQPESSRAGLGSGVPMGLADFQVRHCS
ncbi:SDR family NAD(P)-dependent oxidoreductase [Streptomyces sp. NPDC018026]|uniref:SDR family NAD(P)-dependent oxidoreductase n=1 Tax=Streptomyces sp. NPDC018026 TaxID=3365031 RepID=UPI0037B91B2A